MEFDKNRVFTSVNADELKVGSKVFCAFSISDLKRRVNEGEEITEVFKIFPESKEHRIVVYYKDEYFSYPLAYLISEPEEKKLKVSDLKLGDIVRHKSGKLEYLITGIDCDEKQVFFGDDWSDDENLGKYWEKVENEKGNRAEN